MLLAVVAAHRRGHPLHPELVALGARYAGIASTASSYRLLALAGPSPERGGILRVATGGAAVEVELHRIRVVALGEILVGLPDPLALGRVGLHDGSTVTGMVCAWEPVEAVDVTTHGSWPAYLASRARRPATAATGAARPEPRAT